MSKESKSPTRRHKRAEAERYANMIADLIADESAPPVLRSLADVLCNTLDTFSAKQLDEAGEDFDFKFINRDLIPDVVRGKLPAMIVKLWDWRPAHYMGHELAAPHEPAGTAESGHE